jgi:hypothetical protein
MANFVVLPLQVFTESLSRSLITTILKYLLLVSYSVILSTSGSIAFNDIWSDDFELSHEKEVCVDYLNVLNRLMVLETQRKGLVHTDHMVMTMMVQMIAGPSNHFCLPHAL